MRSLDFEELRHARLPRPEIITSGFLELWIDDDHMLHIWDERLGVPPRANVHNHNYDFESKILVGKLKHSLWKSDSVAGLVLDREDTYSAGDTYTLHRDQFHSILAAEFPSATLVKKLWREERRGEPSDLWKNTEEQTKLFWTIIEDTLKGIQK